MAPNPSIPSVLRKQVNWQNLHFFQKSDVLYQLTATFCRMVDRMMYTYIHATNASKPSKPRTSP